MRLIASLGNPDKKHDQTKHSTGFMTSSHYLSENNLGLDKDKFEGLWIKQKVDDEDVILLGPQTFMNNLGKSITQIASFFKIAPEDILVIHGDMDVPIGRIRVCVNGRSGGRNGIRSIMACLGTNNFNRLKIGIRHPRKESVISQALSPLNGEQQKLMDAIFKVSEDIINDSIKGKNAQYLANQYN